jgi:hypothetical protein
MSHDKITHYMDDLPAVTQYYDLDTLFGLRKGDLEGWTDYKTVWHEVCFFHTQRHWLYPADCVSCEVIT